MSVLGRFEVRVDEATGTRTYLRYTTAFGRLGAAFTPLMIGALFVALPLLLSVGAVGAGWTDGSPVGVIAPLLVVAAFGTYALLSVPASWRLTAGPPELLMVGPDGIAVRDQFRLAWDEIAEVRLVRPLTAFRWAPREYNPTLELVPRDAAVLAGRPWPDRALDASRRLIGRVLPLPALRVAAFRFNLNLLEAPSRPVVADIQRYIEVRGVPATR